MNIPFIDLNAQKQFLGQKIDNAVSKVLKHKKFINGPEVSQFEKLMSEFANASEVITCGSGTDALLLPLMAIGVRKGDAVFVPSFTFVATAEVVSMLNATPVFVDVDRNTFNIDPKKLEEAILHSKKIGLNPKVIIPVDLFGQPAPYKEINQIAEQFSLNVISDAAQSFGGVQNNNPVGGLAHVTSTSFFPSKPLGCYGDGGAVLTNDKTLANILRSLRSHGSGQNKYDNVRIGVNSRLDTIQAAILIEKIKILRFEIEKRNHVADKYNAEIDQKIDRPFIEDGNYSAWAQYTITTKNRDELSKYLYESGIPTVIYYPKPLHLQSAYSKFPRYPEELTVSEYLSGSVLSLPMHPYLSSDQQEYIIKAINKYSKVNKS
ncbi:MAG: UDP-2-acetamido-2-deoxy-3-oxo-D-glucuronate aminotransferase [Alphaproteobacteria bacterium MarineAlpha2_Bin1]|nr:MAG: UDP-2-acetamido-2-deoxy-3-oxo-D-glucuronate aminotransferase [Alphaproteobacteria bacterium MarineAlpha2_Bin1]